MFNWFERLVHPYPDAAPATPPTGFGRFLWSCTDGTRGYIAAMTAFTASIGAFEALLFAMMALLEPGDQPRMKDAQLDKAVEVLMKDVAAWKARPRPELKKASERK